MRLNALKQHWPEYLMEAAELGAFMVSAYAFGARLEHPASLVHQAIPDGKLRRVLMGLARGLTAIGIIYSPWGKQSGALFGVTAQAQHNNKSEVIFNVRIENVSNPDGQVAKDGTRWPFALSPGLFVLHERDVRLFREGNPAVNGLEAQAETGNPSEIVKVLEGREHMGHGVFNTPVGTDKLGPIGPGGAYEFSFTAKPGLRLSVLTMFGQSNDWFYAPKRQGIDLFVNGKPLSGDITNEFMLFDTGTEVDEEPGVGPNQGPRQPNLDAGLPEHGKVHAAKQSSFFTRNGELFKITITPDTLAKM